MRGGWEEGKAQEAEERLWGPDGEAVLSYLRNDRGLHDDTMKEWGLGCHRDRDGTPWLTIPLRDELGTVVNIRYRSIPPAKKMYRGCTGRPLPLFGAHTLTADRSKPVIVLEGELDVLSAWQLGFRDNIVTGTAGAGAWKDEWLDLLEPFDAFWLFQDQDKAGDDGATKFAKVMGESRCFRVRTPYNDLNAALIDGATTEVVEDWIMRAQALINVPLHRADAFIDRVETYFTDPEKMRGRTTGSPKWDKCIGGMRPGLWVVMGQTGHGKTTMAHWMVHQQAMLGVPSMVTSFEQTPTGSMIKFLRMEMGGDPGEASPEARGEAFERLRDLPIYTWDEYGTVDAARVIDSLAFARRRYGVRVALIDHLHFLVTGAGDQERTKTDEIVRQFATQAVKNEMTVLLVVHPNNMWKAQNRRVQLSDGKGSSAIEQDCHVGIVIERQPLSAARAFPAAKIHIDKCRSEYGRAGTHFIMAFDPLSCVYGDTWEDTPSGRAGLRLGVPSP